MVETLATSKPCFRVIPEQVDDTLHQRQGYGGIEEGVQILGVDLEGKSAIRPSCAIESYLPWEMHSQLHERA